MSAAYENAAVGQLVAEHPGRARIFDRHGIDYCCSGGKPLAEACSEKGIDLRVVVRELAQAELPPRQRTWNSASLTELCDHIEQTHHVYLRQELPRLHSLIEKLASMHGQRHPELQELGRVYANLRQELQTHLLKEEHVLFPLLRQMERARRQTASTYPSVQGPIRVMFLEHDSATRSLQRMRELTGDYRLPEDACETYRATFDGLLRLEEDLHQHIHKENNILFPKAVQAEQASRG